MCGSWAMFICFKKIKEALLLTGRKVMDESNINGKGMSIYVLEDLKTIACIVAVQSIFVWKHSKELCCWLDVKWKRLSNLHLKKFTDIMLDMDRQTDGHRQIYLVILDEIKKILMQSRGRGWGELLLKPRDWYEKLICYPRDHALCPRREWKISYLTAKRAKAKKKKKGCHLFVCLFAYYGF